MNTDRPTIVIDNGSYKCKAGFAGDDAPKCEFRTYVGHLRWTPSSIFPPEIMAKVKDHYFGDEAQAKKGILVLKYPIQNGVIVNWDDMEKIWHHTFYDLLSTNPEQHTVILTESLDSSNDDRQKMAEIMFEKFNTPNIYIGLQPELALHSHSLTSGIVLDIGFDVSHAVPIHNGKVIRDAISRLEFGGHTITENMMRIMVQHEFSFLTHGDFNLVSDIKEKYGYVALDFAEEMKNAANNFNLNVPYEFIDGTTHNISTERFACAEALFNPDSINSYIYSNYVNDKLHDGIHDAAYQSIMKCKETIQKDLFQSIVLSGSTSLFPGITERLEKELANLTPQNFKIIAPSDRHVSVWKGGASLALRPGFHEKLCVSNEAYKEHGASVLN